MEELLPPDVQKSLLPSLPPPSVSLGQGGRREEEGPVMAVREEEGPVMAVREEPGGGGTSDGRE